MFGGDNCIRSIDGDKTDLRDLVSAKKATTRPVLVGSGVTPDNLDNVFSLADGFIIGSYFKRDGVPTNDVDSLRVRTLMRHVVDLRKQLPISR